MAARGFAGVFVATVFVAGTVYFVGSSSVTPYPTVAAASVPTSFDTKAADAECDNASDTIGYNPNYKPNVVYKDGTKEKTNLYGLRCSQSVGKGSVLGRCTAPKRCTAEKYVDENGDAHQIGKVVDVGATELAANSAGTLSDAPKTTTVSPDSTSGTKTDAGTSATGNTQSGNPGTTDQSPSPSPSPSPTPSPTPSPAPKTSDSATGLATPGSTLSGRSPSTDNSTAAPVSPTIQPNTARTLSGSTPDTGAPAQTSFSSDGLAQHITSRDMVGGPGATQSSGDYGASSIGSTRGARTQSPDSTFYSGRSGYANTATQSSGSSGFISSVGDLLSPFLSLFSNLASNSSNNNSSNTRTIVRTIVVDNTNETQKPQQAPERPRTQDESNFLNTGDHLVVPTHYPTSYGSTTEPHFVVLSTTTVQDATPVHIESLDLGDILARLGAPIADTRNVDQSPNAPSAQDEAVSYRAFNTVLASTTLAKSVIDNFLTTSDVSRYLATYQNGSTTISFASSSAVMASEPSGFETVVSNLKGDWTGTTKILSQIKLALAQAKSNFALAQAYVRSMLDAKDAGACDAACETSLQELQAELPVRQQQVDVLDEVADKHAANAHSLPAPTLQVEKIVSDTVFAHAIASTASSLPASPFRFAGPIASSPSTSTAPISTAATSTISASSSTTTDETIYQDYEPPIVTKQLIMTAGTTTEGESSVQHFVRTIMEAVRAVFSPDLQQKNGHVCPFFSRLFGWCVQD